MASSRPMPTSAASCTRSPSRPGRLRRRSCAARAPGCGPPTASELIDAMASLWYCNVGHGRGEIADAVADQMRTLEAYSCFEPFTNGAGRRADRAPRRDRADPRRRGCSCAARARRRSTRRSSSPALAQRLAGHPERTVIISRERGYHGTNLGGTSAQGIAPNREGWGPLVPDVVQVPSDDIEALSVLMAERGGEIAAVLTEPVQGAGGVFPPARRLPRRGAGAVRPPRRVADLRRGDHRVRPARHVVRRRPLRRRPRT